MISLPPDAVATLLTVLSRLALVVLRLTPLTLALPFLGGRALPFSSRVPVLVALAVGAMPSLLDVPRPATLGPTILLAVIREISIGMVLALIVAAPLFALEQGGRLLDAVRGANVAEVIAPDTGARSSPLSELLRWTFAVVFLTAGGFRGIVRVVASSLAVVPPDPDARSLLDTAHFVDVAARWTADALGASLTLVGSGLLALVAAEVAFGLVSRWSPPIAQSNLVLPVRVLLPLAGLALTVGVWTGAAQNFASHALDAAGALFRSR